MVFVQAAYPVAMIDNYHLDDASTLVLKSSNNTPLNQKRELSRICDAMQNHRRLAGVEFKGITTQRIGPRLSSFPVFGRPSN